MPLDELRVLIITDGTTYFFWFLASAIRLQLMLELWFAREVQYPEVVGSNPVLPCQTTKGELSFNFGQGKFPS